MTSNEKAFYLRLLGTTPLEPDLKSQTLKTGKALSWPFSIEGRTKSSVDLSTLASWRSQKSRI